MMSSTEIVWTPTGSPINGLFSNTTEKNPPEGGNIQTQIELSKYEPNSFL